MEIQNLNEFELTGGAQIGWSSASYPFATLTVNKDSLNINATIIGNYFFCLDDIISIKPFIIIPQIV